VPSADLIWEGEASTINDGELLDQFGSREIQNWQSRDPNWSRSTVIDRRSLYFPDQIGARHTRCALQKLIWSWSMGAFKKMILLRL
jgi:hypothetical protein